MLGGYYTTLSLDVVHDMFVLFTWFTPVNERRGDLVCTVVN